MSRLTLALVLVTCLFACSVSAVSTPRDQAKVTSLPRIDFTPTFDQYAGYITINNQTNKNLFYWFMTSQNNPATDPVVLWLQGGPGCSGLAGLFEEHGPYYTTIVNATAQIAGLTSAFYSWNREANVIYIEAPCGVGFSYSDVDSDYITNDNTTAMDNFLFLNNFFQIYPDFSSNIFWITGESYGGVYIPTLAYTILTNNSNPTLTANLKRGGLMLGNPVTNCGGTSYNGQGDILGLDTVVNTFYWHAMVSRRNYDTWNNLGCNTANPPSLSKCYDLYAVISKGLGHFDQPLEKQSGALFAQSREIQHRVAGHFAGQTAGAINPDCLYFSYCAANGTLSFTTDIVPECFGADDQLSSYLNDPTVQTAIHAKAKKLPWRTCGGVAYTKNVGSLIPYLEDIFSIAPTVRILYYSGDIDINTVPFPNTQRCLETMQRPIISEWRPWIVNKEVAGYVEVYDTYTYVTVKGAGHETPEYQPADAFVMFSSFLKQTPLPSN